MNQQVPTEAETKPAWSEKLASLLARNRFAQALRLLDRIIEEDLPLFRDNPEELEGKRTAWLCRIDLLRERERLAEALAWTCLECEINTNNVTAQALKEQLKRDLHLGSSVRREGPRRPHRDSDGWEGVAGMRERPTTIAACGTSWRIGRRPSPYFGKLAAAHDAQSDQIRDARAGGED